MTQDTDNFTFGDVLGMPAIIITGPFDFMNANIDAFVDDIISKGLMNLVLDLTAAHYITSTGIATIVKIIKKIKAAGGLLHLAGATDDMMELVKLGHMDTYVSYIAP
ncbi:MAG: STAS domain-containing protein [Chitinispirillaceae bacterium]|nr:STAS domain-containing protein [Chitinispirillaceae bacterium]